MKEKVGASDVLARNVYMAYTELQYCYSEGFIRKVSQGILGVAIIQPNAVIH